VLALGPDRRALANKEVAIAIEDEEGNEQFHETVKTSRFGVAHTEWNIPQKLRLGTYQAGAQVKGSEDEDDYDSQPARASLRVSRYELPTFTVKASPTANTTCRSGRDSGDQRRLPFRQTVQNANVRLVKQQDRRWDFKEQKWSVEDRIQSKARSIRRGNSKPESIWRMSSRASIPMTTLIMKI